MIEYEKKIAQQTLSILKKKTWNSYSLDQVLKNVKVKNRKQIADTETQRQSGR